MAYDRKNGSLKGIEPDSKSQVTMMYENGKPKKVTSVVISTQHSPKVNQAQVKEIVRPYLEKSIPNINIIRSDNLAQILIDNIYHFLLSMWSFLDLD